MSCAGVFERSELESLLLDARVKGKARPEILEQFNEAKQCVCSCFVWKWMGWLEWGLWSH